MPKRAAALTHPPAASSTGNVFTDLGFSPEEAENLKIRSTLMMALHDVIAAAPNQATAARLLGVTQPRVSDLMRGKIDLFSIDTLIDLLVRAGAHVDLNITMRAA